MNGSALLISEGILGLSKEIINGHIIKICETDQHIRGNIPLTQLIVAVGTLRTIEIFSKLSLF